MESWIRENWPSQARQVPATLVVDCRGVHDALSRFSSSCLGLKDKKSGLEALALKQSLVDCGTITRWCRSAAQLGDVVTEDSDTSRAPWDLFVRRGFRWKLRHDPQNLNLLPNVDFTFWKNLTKTSLQPGLPRDPKNVTLIT